MDIDGEMDKTEFRGVLYSTLLAMPCNTHDTWRSLDIK